ncbi:phage head-tail connector protein [Salinicoccus roseus]|uniref:phage head-tail connector protein n=1 Tax=Salinicoccus roseus TaxID=45670 RepID=UPI003526A2BF
MNATKVKVLNEWDIADASKDERIEALIPHYAQVAEEYCHRPFPEPYPAKVQEFIARMIQHHNNGVISRSMGSVSYTWDAEAEAKAYKLIRPFRRVNWGGSYEH